MAGFINLRLAPRVWHSVLAQILREGERFGARPSNGVRISLEFGSANPTGPLVVVQGRSMSIGATLANAMRFCGYDVYVEWIINDAGGQLDALGRSIYARYRQLFDPSFPLPENGYPGRVSGSDRASNPRPRRRALDRCERIGVATAFLEDRT